MRSATSSPGKILLRKLRRSLSAARMLAHALWSLESHGCGCFYGAKKYDDEKKEEEEKKKTREGEKREREITTVAR